MTTSTRTPLSPAALRVWGDLLRAANGVEQPGHAVFQKLLDFGFQPADLPATIGEFVAKVVGGELGRDLGPLQQGLAAARALTPEELTARVDARHQRQLEDYRQQLTELNEARSRLQKITAAEPPTPEPGDPTTVVFLYTTWEQALGHARGIVRELEEALPASEPVRQSEAAYEEALVHRLEEDLRANEYQNTQTAMGWATAYQNALAIAAWVLTLKLDDGGAD
ncbi:MAG TPA: hypothetical protein VMT30_03625 [Candidatus Saccharimonadia bacterium]|nr:hypothetical protein [Candidatus Saccharimonadia bacterium]